MSVFEVFEVVVLPFVAFHAVATLRRDWRHAPIVPGRSEVSRIVRFFAACTLSSWVVTHLAPSLYYLFECARVISPLLV